MERKKAVMASFQLTLLICASFAFSYIIWSASVVSSYENGDTRVIEGNTWIRNEKGEWTTLASGYESLTWDDGLIDQKTSSTTPKIVTPLPVPAGNAPVTYVYEYALSPVQGYENPSNATIAKQNSNGNFDLFNSVGKQVGSITANELMKNFKLGAGTDADGKTDAKGGFFGEGGVAKMVGLSGTGAGLFNTALWAGVAAGAGYLIGKGIMGWNNKNSIALSAGLGGGVLTWRLLSQFAPGWAGSWSGLANFGIGAAVGAAIFLALYRQRSTETVTFQCLPWQAPRGGADCEKCNDELFPCSEYRCKSLGQTCGILNAGTKEEMCANINPNDVEPPTITPDDTVITAGYKYSEVNPNPPGPGFKIIGLEQTCIKPFTPLKFGIYSNEPSQCKIDYNNTATYDEMKYYLGGSNIFEYNHTEQLSLPNPSAIKNGSFILNNGGEWTFYLRCIDGNGNYNAAAYAIRLCVDDSPDSTPPEILATSIDNGGCIADNRNDANVEFYTNEPSTCRWAHEDRDYDEMPYNMQCDNQIYQMNAMELYTCRANLTGVARDDTPFYVRCKDKPDAEENDRNENRQSLVFTLRMSDALKMKNLLPDNTVYSGTNPAPVSLEAETIFGCTEGKAICFFSTTGKDEDYIQFFETDDIFHKQRLDLTSGTYKYYIKCVDEGGNVAVNTTTFEVNIETAAPIVARAYEEGGMLKILTVKESDCSYSFKDCDFTFAEGTEMPTGNTTIHVAEWQKDKTYYIKCRDKFKNEPPECSIIVKPQNNFL